MIGSDRRGLFSALEPNEPEEKKIVFCFLSTPRSSSAETTISFERVSVCVRVRSVRPIETRARVCLTCRRQSFYAISEDEIWLFILEWLRELAKGKTGQGGQRRSATQRSLITWKLILAAVTFYMPLFGH